MTRHFVRTVPAVLALTLVACGYDNSDRERVDPGESDDVADISDRIDTGSSLTDITSGAGIFVEYASGGNWKVQVSCDVGSSNSDCKWGIYAYTQVGVSFTSIAAIDLESDDDLQASFGGELTLYTTTAGDVDGVSFSTTPGEAVTFSFSLDGSRHPEDYFFYATQGAVKSGIAAPAIKLTPTVP